MKVLEKSLTIAGIIFFLWLAISWMNVVANNDPFDSSKTPAPWNAFTLITEAIE